MTDWQLVMVLLASGLIAFFAVIAVLDRDVPRTWMHRPPGRRR
jgi:hypothetical protein